MHLVVRATIVPRWRMRFRWSSTRNTGADGVVKVHLLKRCLRPLPAQPYMYSVEDEWASNTHHLLVIRRQRGKSRNSLFYFPLFFWFFTDVSFCFDNSKHSSFPPPLSYSLSLWLSVSLSLSLSLSLYLTPSLSLPSLFFSLTSYFLLSTLWSHLTPIP